MKTIFIFLLTLFVFGGPAVAVEGPVFDDLWTFENADDSNYQGGLVVKTDAKGNIFAAGHFGETVDFDPGPEQDLHVSNGIIDAYVTKINSDGSYGWTITFGGPEQDFITDLVVDSSGNLLMTGLFTGIVDFDPGPGQDIHTSTGWPVYPYADVFVTKIGNDGSYQWTRTFGGLDGDIGRGVAVNENGDLIVTGQFKLVVDFDPGPGEDRRTSSGDNDAFFTRYDSNGSYEWVRTIGGKDYDSAEAIAFDSEENIIVAGSFGLTVDFDPGPGQDLRRVHNPVHPYARDLFLAKYSGLDGSYRWAYTVGSEDNDYYPTAQALDVITDVKGDVYATGKFAGATDFDPGPGKDIHTSGERSSGEFVVRLQSDGTYLWAKTIHPAGGWGIAMDSSGVIIVGHFSHPQTPKYEGIDFDPGPGVDLRQPQGNLVNLFTTKLYFDGSYAWTYTVGNDEPGKAGYGIYNRGVDVTPDGKILSTGYYSGLETDFDAGPGQALRTTLGPMDVDIFILKLRLEDK